MLQNRRLAAIMFTDIVGFSRLTNQNPLRARELNEEHQKIVRAYLQKYEGFERQTTGDGFFIEFKSAIQAMNCAIEVQQALHDRNLTRSSENQVQIRIGLHLGDIFEKNNEIFGDGVNIASRLEALAEPGGVCVSKTFCDLVKSNWSEHKFSSVGGVQLKNIEGEFELFKFNFPWQKKEEKKLKSYFNLFRSIFNQEQWSLALLFILGAGLLLFILAKVFFPQFQSMPASSLSPSSSAEKLELKLESGWQYAVGEDEWQNFIPKESWRYADLIQGSYQLKNEFLLDQKPIEPALLLGLVSDSHRVYLNDQYIGGSEHLSDLALYLFDPSVLKLPPERNIILVKGKTRPNLNPGLILLDDSKPQIGEFSRLEDLRSRYFFRFYILKNIYFVFSFIIFLLSLTYAVYLRNKNEIFYSSLFLLLGCLGYSYYNPWVSSTFDYQFLRFLRVSGIVMSSIVLYSGYLAARGYKGLVSWNNLLALVVGVASFCILNFYSFATSKNFVSVYNGILLLGFVYVASASTTALVREFSQRKNRKGSLSLLEAYFFLGFTFFSLFNILGSFKNSQSEVFFSSQMRAWFSDVGLSITFLFAVSRVTLAVFEFTQQKRQNMLNRRKDDFFIELTRVVSESRSTADKIDRIQNLAHQFLKSEKSSLYLVDPCDSQKLKVHSVQGYSTEIESVKSASAGVFGYVLQNRRPLLIEDIQQDYRFERQNATDLLELRSGSCMLFPLVVEDQILGVMSFLDKENGRKFEMSDLEIGLKMSTFISLLISSAKEYQKVG